MSHREAFVIPDGLYWTAKFQDYFFLGPGGREIFVKANEGELYGNQVVVLELTDMPIEGTHSLNLNRYWKLITNGSES